MAFRSNMHMDFRVIEVASFKSVAPLLTSLQCHYPLVLMVSSHISNLQHIEMRESVPHPSLLKDEVLAMLSFSFVLCPPPPLLSLLLVVGSVGSAIVPPRSLRRGNPLVQTDRDSA